LLLDGGKGAIAAAIAWALIGETAGLIAGFAAVLGHNFPVWLKFKGGKGVATTLGAVFVMAWPVGLGACATWLVMANLFRISSLAALTALALAPVYALLLGKPDQAIMFAGLAVLGFIRHETNIRRLLKGEEPKLGKKKPAE